MLWKPKEKGDGFQFSFKNGDKYFKDRQNSCANTVRITVAVIVLFSAQMYFILALHVYLLQVSRINIVTFVIEIIRIK